MEFVEEDRVWRGWNRRVHCLRYCVPHMMIAAARIVGEHPWVAAIACSVNGGPAGLNFSLLMRSHKLAVRRL